MRENQKISYEELFNELGEQLNQSLKQFSVLNNLPSYLKQVNDEEVLSHYQKSLDIEARLFSKLNTDYLPFLPREDLLQITIDVVKIIKELTQEHKHLTTLITEFNISDCQKAFDITEQFGIKLYHTLAHINRYKKIDVNNLLNIINEAQTSMILWQWETKVSVEIKMAIDKVFHSIIKAFESFILICFKNT